MTDSKERTLFAPPPPSPSPDQWVALEMPISVGLKKWEIESFMSFIYGIIGSIKQLK